MSRVERGLHWALDLALHRRFPVAASSFRATALGRILVVHKYNIGDLLCATPALRALRRAFPEAYLAVLVSSHCRPVLDRNPDVDKVFVYRKAKHDPRWFGVPALWGLVRVLHHLRAHRFDLAIALGRPCSRSAAWLAYASGAPWRLGYAGARQHPFRWFLNLARDPGAITSHEVDGCLDLVSSIGVPAAGRTLTLVPDPKAQAVLDRRLREAGRPERGGLALVHISNRRETSRWPPAAFAQAADLLHERLGLTTVLSWAPGDARNPLFPGDDGKAEAIAQRMRARPILLATPTLDELIAAVSLSNFVLSTDGGLMHIAAALDVPQVVLFGKTGVAHWAPVSEKSALLQRGARVDGISVDEVVAAAAVVMARWGREGVAASLARSRPSGCAGPSEDPE